MVLLFLFLGRFSGDSCGIHDHRQGVRQGLGQRGGQLERQRHVKHMGRQRHDAQLGRRSVRPISNNEMTIN